MSESRTVEQEFWSAWGVGHVKDSQRDTRDRNASTSQVLLKRVDADGKYLSTKALVFGWILEIYNRRMAIVARKGRAKECPSTI